MYSMGWLIGCYLLGIISVLLLILVCNHLEQRDFDAEWDRYRAKKVQEWERDSQMRDHQ